MSLSFTPEGFCGCCGVFAFRRPGAVASAFVCEAQAETTTTTPVAGRAATAFAAGTLVIAGATVVDPRTGARQADAAVVMRQGRIVQVGGETPAPGPDVAVLDGAGGWLVPGYNDMHTHVLELAEPAGALALMLAEGVTGFRQMSGSTALLAARREGRLRLPDAGPAALELPGDLMTPLNAATPEDARAEVRRQKGEGADFAKAGMMGADAFLAALDEAAKVGLPLLGHLQDGVDAAEASRLGFRSIEHLGPGAAVWLGCSSQEAALKADTPPPRMRPLPKWAGMLKPLIMWRLQTILINPAAFAPEPSIAHLGRAAESFDAARFADLAERFAADGTWHVPTLVRLRTQHLAEDPAYQAADFLRFMPAANIRKWRQVTARFSRLSAQARRTYAELYPRELALAKALHDAGVKMMAGTDGGMFGGPGQTLREEFAELAKAGIAPLDILRMATCNPADYLGRADRMGAVEPGMDADLVLLDADPAEGVENLHAIRAVVRAGRAYPKAELDRLEAQVACRRGRLN